MVSHSDDFSEVSFVPGKLNVVLKSSATEAEWDELCATIKRIYAKCEEENLEFIACYDIRFIDLSTAQLISALSMFEDLRATTRRLCKRSIFIVSPNIMTIVNLAFSWYKPTKPVDLVNSSEEAEKKFKQEAEKKFKQIHRKR